MKKKTIYLINFDIHIFWTRYNYIFPKDTISFRLPNEIRVKFWLENPKKWWKQQR